MGGRSIFKASIWNISKTRTLSLSHTHTHTHAHTRTRSHTLAHAHATLADTIAHMHTAQAHDTFFSIGTRSHAYKYKNIKTKNKNIIHISISRKYSIIYQYQGKIQSIFDVKEVIRNYHSSFLTVAAIQEQKLCHAKY